MFKKILMFIIFFLILFFIFFFFIPIPISPPNFPHQQLCNDVYSQDPLCKAESVNPCQYQGSQIYRVNYNCVDTPAKYFDSNLELIADYCWGMPLPDETNPPEICIELDKQCNREINLCN
jgi:hypothetical protein